MASILWLLRRDGKRRQKNKKKKKERERKERKKKKKTPRWSKVLFLQHKKTRRVLFFQATIRFALVYVSKHQNRVRKNPWADRWLWHYGSILLSKVCVFVHVFIYFLEKKKKIIEGCYEVGIVNNVLMISFFTSGEKKKVYGSRQRNGSLKATPTQEQRGKWRRATKKRSLTHINTAHSLTHSHTHSFWLQHSHATQLTYQQQEPAAVARG